MVGLESGSSTISFAGRTKFTTEYLREEKSDRHRRKHESVGFHLVKVALWLQQHTPFVSCLLARRINDSVNAAA